MGLFSDIISTIGNGVSDVFGGGDNNDQKKKQQQQQAPQAPAPSFNNGPVKLPAVFQQAQQQQQSNPLQLFHPANQQPNPLQPQQPPADAPKIATASYAPPAQHQSLFSHLLHGAEDVGEGAASVGAGAALGTLRVGEGLVQSVGELPNDVTHLGTLGLNKAGVISDQTRTNVNNDVNGATNTVLSPVNWLANKTDEATGMFNHENGDPTITGKLIHDIYTPAQVAANIATVAPGIAAVAPKIAALAGDTGKIGDVIDAVKGFTDAQSATPTLSKVPILGSVIDHIPGLGGKPTDDDTAGATGDKAPVESGTKAPGEPSNAPAGEKNAPPEKAPGAVETGIKPPAAAPEEAGVPAVKPAGAAPAAVAVAPTLEKTGDTGQDLQNATGLVKNVLENGRDYSGEGGNKNPLQRVLDLANSHLHSNDIISSALNSRLAAHLTSDEAGNVRNAIEAGSNKGLSSKEAAVVKAIKGNIQKPSDVTRTNLSKDYQSAQNHFPQVRQVGVRDAAAGASKSKGITGKLNTFTDLLNRNSRFSEGSSIGNFTRAGKTITGDANKLGLVAKKDGTFVDKAGKVYQYTRATSQDLEKSGAKIQAPKDALTAYVRDTLNLKTRADASDYLIKNSDALGLDDTPSPGKASTVTIKGSDGESHSFNTDEKTAKTLNESGILGNLSKEANLPIKAWNALSSFVAQGTVANPFAHGLNLATNAAVGAGERANGITGVSTLLRSLKPIDEATELRMSDAGVHFPTYGKNVTNILSKLTGGASKWNETAVSAIDRQVRSGMFENLTKGGASDRDAADIINKWMGGRGTYKGDNAQLGIFWNYFGRQVKNAGRLVTQATQGHPGALINAAIAGGATYAADQGLKSATGNSGAYIHTPGVVGILNDAYNSGKDIATGQDRSAINPLVSHVNPVLSTAVEQALGVNEYGDKFNGTTNTRGANILQTVPELNAFNNNGHSGAEKALNTFGVYTPHVKGDEAAAPGTIPGNVLNIKGAQSGATLAFPKDFNGEQEQKVVNGLGNNYTTKSAAILGTQTQGQQQKYVQSVNTLKKYGVTDQADIENFFKLSTKDQGSYVDAIDALNKAGTAVSSASVETQLVENGKTDLAASIDKSIPNSLSPQDKEALVTYNTKGSDGQKNVWLQNNDNASNYYQAVINQKNAQGALTTDDTDTGTVYSGSGGSLYTKYLVAQTDKQNNVPQSTVELYSNTTKTEYDNMSGSQKDTLTAYAQQLNKNGVIDKFGLATGSGGSGGSSGGSSAYSVDKAAGLPYGTISESFVKPTSDPGIKASSPLAFKAPTLLKYTPDEKSNPYTRSISVKAGVK
jgi:hypothetical protein